MNIFRGSSSREKNPVESVKVLEEDIGKLKKEHKAHEGSKKRTEIKQNVSQELVALKGYLEGGEASLVVQLTHEIYGRRLLYDLIENMELFEFESRKTITAIFIALLHHRIGSRWPTVDYLTSNRDIVMLTLKGYGSPQIGLNTGIILQEMIKHESIARVILYDRRLYDFLYYIEQTTFGIACDAQNAFRALLTRHRDLAASFLEENYDTFFDRYRHLLNSSNYVTKRQSVKLLAELLLDRANNKVMGRYVADEENLKLIMNLLKDKSKNIQYEAFHVFKIFVANPKKPAQITSILKRNKGKLVDYLSNFSPEKSDEQFVDEKLFVISQINIL